jgi:crotonobetainyl-CoA:carnitine CoA-transferase CaiB-like acyl-CoA transferase
MLPLAELQNPEYEKQPARLRDKQKIDAAIGLALQRESTAYWLAQLRTHRIPCGPVNNFAQALSDPQVVARDMVKKVRLVGGDEIPTTGVPMKFSSTNAQYFTAPPRVGEDSEAVLRDLLGYSDTKIGELAESGVLGVHS